MTVHAEAKSRPFRLRLWVLFGVLIGLLTGPGTVAQADDNVTDWHWHGGEVGYHINTQVPSAWVSEIQSAANSWTSQTAIGIVYEGRTSNQDPRFSDEHIVWHGQIPSDWHDFCPPDNTPACVRWTYMSDNHLVDADMVFNDDFSFTTSDTACLLGNNLDVQTVALHEFGHFGVLEHTDDAGAVMYPTLLFCRRQLSDHDVESMDLNYAGH